MVDFHLIHIIGATKTTNYFQIIIFSPFINSLKGCCFLAKKCKSCFASSMREIYKRDPEKRKLQVRLLEDRIGKELDDIKRISGCKYCEEKEPICLDFHHEDASTKDENVSTWVHLKSRVKALEEAKKCIVVCANCHRKLHNGLL